MSEVKPTLEHEELVLIWVVRLVRFQHTAYLITDASWNFRAREDRVYPFTQVAVDPFCQRVAAQNEPDNIALKFVSDIADLELDVCSPIASRDSDEMPTWYFVDICDRLRDRWPVHREDVSRAVSEIALNR